MRAHLPLFRVASTACLLCLLVACSKSEKSEDQQGGADSQGQAGSELDSQGGATEARGGASAQGRGGDQARGGSSLGGSGQGGQQTTAGAAQGGQNGGSPGRGGTQGAGGAQGRGGSPSSGGETTQGGETALGGATTSGGSPAQGGEPEAGGAPPSAGGSPAAGSTSEGGASAGAGVGGSEGTPEVRLVGRMDTSDPEGARFAWSGSGMVARFRGTAVTVNLAGGQEYTVVLDGEVEEKLVADDGENIVASGLTDDIHTIELYRRTEANQGESLFRGMDFPHGELLAPPPAPARKLEIIGDSITCGYGNEGTNRNCGFSPDTENHYLTYGAIAARDLGAELITIAWSGKGVVCNYGDGAGSCEDPMPIYYDRILPDRSDSQWDFSKYQPDAVIVNLGTNDLSTEEDPSQGDFEEAYLAFLEQIREKNPNAFILCTNGSMLSGSELDTIRGYIDDVVTTMNQAGDDRVASFEIEPQLESDDYGCDWHPNLVTHQKMAETLKAALEATLGW